MTYISRKQRRNCGRAREPLDLLWSSTRRAVNTLMKIDSMMRRGVCGWIKGIINLKRFLPTCKLVFALAFALGFERNT